MSETLTLSAWSAACAAKLGLSDVEVDREAIHILLDLARDAAHQVVRPASPLTCYLVGLAVGRGMSLERAAALATELALEEGTVTQYRALRHAAELT